MGKKRGYFVALTAVLLFFVMVAVLPADIAPLKYLDDGVSAYLTANSSSTLITGFAELDAGKSRIIKLSSEWHKEDMTPKSKLLFRTMNETYELSVSQVYNDRVDFIIGTQEFTSKIGQVKSFDVDDDGVDDIKFEVLNIIITKVSVAIAEIEKVAKLPKKDLKGDINIGNGAAAAGAQQDNIHKLAKTSVKEQPTPESELPKVSFYKRYNKQITFFAGIMALILVSIAALVAFSRKPSSNILGESEKLKLLLNEKDESRHESRLELILDYVSNLNRNGLNNEQVIKVLKRIKLSDKLIELILDELNNQAALHRLVDYCYTQLEKGIPEERVRISVENAGWNKEVVNLLFE